MLDKKNQIVPNSSKKLINKVVLKFSLCFHNENVAININSKYKII